LWTKEPSKLKLEGSEAAEALKAYDGKDVLVGVRPEDLMYHEGGLPKAKTTSKL
jgi:hypothetical protein